VNLPHQQQQLSSSIMGALKEPQVLFALPIAIPKSVYSYHYHKTKQPKSTSAYYDITQVYKTVVEKVLKNGQQQRSLRLPPGKEATVAGSIACGEWDAFTLVDLLHTGNVGTMGVTSGYFTAVGGS
jgi:hypothetical protein